MFAGAGAEAGLDQIGREDRKVGSLVLPGRDLPDGAEIAGQADGPERLALAGLLGEKIDYKGGDTRLTQADMAGILSLTEIRKLTGAA